MKIKTIFTALTVLAAFTQVEAQLGKDSITQSTPSRSEYFSWINNTNEGANERQTLVNLDFFRWLKDTYGMQLDIYAFDAGAIDGARIYGSTSTDRFKRHFPGGFSPIAKSAAAMNTKLGLWCGPDGFGDTDAEAQQRIDMMAGLAENYNFGLFKMDGVCGQLRSSKYDWFEKMMTRIRRAVPDFVLLNHRLDLGPGNRFSTTYLLGGAETYIDVLMTNSMTAPHHRGQAVSRENTPDLTRLTEDHGVCLSSCLDYWEDDLVLQAFARSLVLAPELYGNPWFLRDDEFPQLAFYFNLHRQYRDILVNGMTLPEDIYGPKAVARGDANTRFLALRNLSWKTVTYHIKLGQETGLENNGSKVKARLYHPYILDLGSHSYGGTIDVEVLPFRAALVKLTNVEEKDKVLISGIPYRIINDYSATPEVELLGMPGNTYKAKVEKGNCAFSRAVVDGKKTVLPHKSFTVTFGGQKLTEPFCRHIADMKSCQVPADAQSVYYSTCYAGSSNALETQSLKRAGETSIPQVKAARDEFFNQEVFRKRELWDKYMFDGDPSTAFSVSVRWGEHNANGSTMLLLDMNEVQTVDRLTIECPDNYSMSPYNHEEGATLWVSPDLVTWKSLVFPFYAKSDIDVSGLGEFRYVRLDRTPLRISEISATRGNKQIDRSKWRASNLFNSWRGAKQSWSSSFTLDEIPEGAYLCIAVNGKCDSEGAYAGIKVDGKYVGCPDRAPSYPANSWEFRIQKVDKNYTYYVPLTADMKGKTIEAFVLSFGSAELNPQVWLNTYPIPFGHKTLTLRK
jgi:hypothetical protein